MTDLHQVLADLTAETEVLDGLLSGLDEAGWKTPTPAPGWTIHHQIAHLSHIFDMAGLSAGDPEAFTAMTARLSEDFKANIEAAMKPYLAQGPGELLATWRGKVAASVANLAAVPPDQTVPWLVRPLPPAILACAGIMETLGHGQDVFDALGVRREWTDRIVHLVGFAVLVQDFGYEARGLNPPTAPFRYELTLPSGTPWEFGPEDAENRISGPASDFCLLVLRRRHRDDLALTATGAAANLHLDVAQAYRGPAGEGRKPGQFAAAAKS
ncbi:TIGR03084 family protein [Actinomadura sp. KC06]|uniref:TIGR03084 family metal-binding protein n=1 Tax=Actinomadura sp. KC06 TaxID=2530369 RepID=UPI001042C42B|nr:TIGR03084 family metal-binding protein [Actinomadura sp. KC06]TDD35516.1 TIGR03084 family protein [Actinomadura sp. KC06]